jgi:hypothetical protein
MLSLQLILVKIELEDFGPLEHDALKMEEVSRSKMYHSTGNLIPDD